MTPPASNLRRSPTPTGDAAPLPALAAASANARAMIEAEERASGRDAGGLPSWQQGSINPSFTHAAPPGFGPRRGSVLGQDEGGLGSEVGDSEWDGEREKISDRDTTPGIFGEGGYDSDAEEGTTLPDETFDDEDEARKYGSREETIDWKAMSVVDGEMTAVSASDDVMASTEIGEGRERVESHEYNGEAERVRTGNENEDEEEHEEMGMGMAEEMLGRSLAAELASL